MKNLPEHWRDRLEAEGWKAESLILLARLVAEMVEQAASGGLTPAGERLLSEQTIPIDWAKAYSAAPIFLARIVTHVDPSITPLPPSGDQLFGAWLRTTLEKVDRLVRRLEHRTDPTSGLLLEETLPQSAMQRLKQEAQHHADDMRIELKAAVDNLTSLLVWKKPMGELLEAAEAGDASAVLQVLQVNPRLAEREGISRVVQRALTEQHHAFVKDLRKVGSRPILPKHAKIGLILSVFVGLGPEAVDV
ncbi:MAG TPA: hypothetical protein VK901_07510 [Nitrospiraceae bacterium]|nr:hypothetical protein [Nitrospiraceae bacterium]